MTSGNIECKQMRFYCSTKGLTFRALLNNSAGYIRSSCSKSDQLFIFIRERPRDQEYIVRFITVLINSCTSTKPFVSKCRAEYLFLAYFCDNIFMNRKYYTKFSSTLKTNWCGKSCLFLGNKLDFIWTQLKKIKANIYQCTCIYWVGFVMHPDLIPFSLPNNFLSIITFCLIKTSK